MSGRDKDISGDYPAAQYSDARGRVAQAPRPGTSSTFGLRKPAQPASPSPSRIGDIPGMTPPRSEVRSYSVEGKTLVVGREISLAGQIDACEKLVVEGKVEANLDHCRQLDIMPSGLFKGSANIDDCEIAGRFEGTLRVNKRLRVRSSGRIIGELSYAQMEIEVGGVICGDVRLLEPEAKEQKKPLAGPSREGGAIPDATE